MIFEVTSKDFHDQLDEFLKEYDFSSFYPIAPKDLKKLNNLLIDVWSNTPIRIEYVEAFNLSFEKDDIDGGVMISGGSVK